MKCLHQYRGRLLGIQVREICNMPAVDLSLVQGYDLRPPLVTHGSTVTGRANDRRELSTGSAASTRPPARTWTPRTNKSHRFVDSLAGGP
jgi:hypothetical protein